MCSEENLNIGNDLDYVPEVETILGYRFTTTSHHGGCLDTPKLLA